MILANATLAGGARADVRLDGPVVAEVATAGTLDGSASLDLSGYVLLPAPAEPHAHLDKALTLDRVVEQPGDLGAAIAAWHRERRELPVDDIASRAERAARQSLARGTTAIRTHVDVGEGIELRGVEALIDVRDRMRDVVDIQVVALTYPLAEGPGAADNRSLLREALELGVDVVGGAPHVDADPLRHMQICLQLAEEFGRPVDLHMDEHTRPTAIDLGDLARLVVEGDLGAVAASHCVSLGLQSEAAQLRIAADVAAAGVSVITCPATNLHLQARDVRTATPRGLTALWALLREGVEIAGGGDNVQDFFHPLGCGDPLQTAALLVLAGQLDPGLSYDLVSRRAREVLGIPAGGIEAGAPAELLAVAGDSLQNVLATATEDRVVFRRGELVERTRVVRDNPGIAIEER